MVQIAEEERYFNHFPLVFFILFIFFNTQSTSFEFSATALLQMNSTVVPEPFALYPSQLRRASSASLSRHLPYPLLSPPSRNSASTRGSRSHRSLAITSNGSGLMRGSTPLKGGVYTVGDFMTKKKNLFTVKPSTTVDEGLEILVENRISGFPVVDDDRKLVGLVSDYDLLALDLVSGSGKTDGGMFPVVDSNWKVFNELQKLLIKTNGKLISNVMTVAPIVVRENTNLEDAARLLLETRYRQLPVVDADGKLVGLITRGDVIRAALKMKRAAANN